MIRLASLLFVVTQTALVAMIQGQSCAFIGSCFFDRNIDKSIPCAVNQPPMDTLLGGSWNEFVVRTIGQNFSFFS